MHDLDPSELADLDAAGVRGLRFSECTPPVPVPIASGEYTPPEGARYYRLEWRFERHGKTYGSAIELTNWRVDMVVDRGGEVHERVRVLTRVEIDAMVRSTRRTLIDQMLRTAAALVRESDARTD